MPAQEKGTREAAMTVPGALRRSALTFESARTAGSDRIAELNRIFQRDEAQECGTLLGHIEAPGELPSRGGSDLWPKVPADYPF